MLTLLLLVVVVLVLLKEMTKDAVFFAPVKAVILLKIN